MNHTPGPWIIDDKAGDRFGQRVWVQAEHGNYICELVRDGRFRERVNAQLISAAPDLLLALKELLNANDAIDQSVCTRRERKGTHCDCRKCVEKRARAAIVKAERGA